MRGWTRQCLWRQHPSNSARRLSKSHPSGTPARGTPSRPEDKRASFQCYMHRTGHWPGMDVPHCGSYVEPSALGLYIRPAAGVPEQFHHIGIRIEDDAIVTATGCELITRGVPVKADEIEALMRA